MEEIKENRKEKDPHMIKMSQVLTAFLLGMFSMGW
jgi:hypothetical protein